MRPFIAFLMGLVSCVAVNARPHLIVFLTDDLGWEDTSVYGSPDARTPHLESLARMGMTFDNAFVASPACAPSRAALLTGLMPARNGAEANHTWPRPGVPYLTSALKGLGYEIAAFGKVAHGNDKPEYGFDYYSRPRVDLAANVNRYFARRESDSPLCLIVGDRRPHVPWTEDNVYDPDQVQLPPHFVDTPETREHWARYLSDITGLDQELGSVMEAARRELGEDIVYVFTSDHGRQWPFGKWNLYDSGVRVPLIVAWQGRIKPGTRTDAMVSWVDLLPTMIDLAGGEPPANVDGRSFSAILTDQAHEHRTEIFTTHSGDGRFNVYPIRSIRTMRYKYILNLLPSHMHTNHSDILRKDWAGAYWDSWDEAAKLDSSAAATVERYFQRPVEELFDVRSDPTEQRNLVGIGKYKELARDLRGRLERWMHEQGDKRTVFAEPYPMSGPRPDAGTVGR